MKATRVIPGRPEASGSEVASAIIDLVTSTLSNSSVLDPAAVRSELGGVESLLALLANGGHLADADLVLVAGTLRLTIEVPVGEAALAADRDVRPPSGTATATTWTLHLPCPAHLAPAISCVVEEAAHLTAETAPADAPTTGAAGLSVDLSRLGGGVR